MLIPANARGKHQSGDVFLFIRNYWRAIAELWPNEFEDKAKYRLQRTSSQRGLARFGKHVCLKLEPAQDYTVGSIKACFNNDPSKMDWSLEGPFQFATGKGGDRQVYAKLVEQYETPS